MSHELHGANLAQVAVHLPLVVKTVGTSFHNDLDSVVVAVTELAFVGPEEHCLVQVVHDNSKADLGHLDLVQIHFVLIPEIDYQDHGCVHDDQLRDRQLDHWTEFLLKDKSHGIFLTLVNVKQFDLAQGHQ